MALHVQRQEAGMTEVRRHQRQTASGKTTTVRQHHRDTGGGGARERPERFLLTVRSRSGKPINMITRAPEDTVMVHGREDLERRIRAAERDPDLVVSYRDDRPPPPQASSLEPGDRPEPDWSWLDGDGEPAGDFWADDEQEPSPAQQREAAVREAGYDGPVDENGNPASRMKRLRALFRAEREQDSARERFCYAKTVAERDAAERDWEAAKARFETLSAQHDQ